MLKKGRSTLFLPKGSNPASTKLQRFWLGELRGAANGQKGLPSMRYNEVASQITSLSNNERLDFIARAARLKAAVDALTAEEVLEHLDYSGLIPECFGHGSSDEKLYAKYCDALLARALRELGLKARSILEGTDAAPVSANGDDYSIVGDAKAFRLSRPPMHQKDFSVEAINKCRKGATFAFLVCPLYQYPSKPNQIYELAVKFNVTLLSYTHIGFMIKRGPEPRPSLKGIWKEIIDRGSIQGELQRRKRRRQEGSWRVGKSLKGMRDPDSYWRAFDRAMLAWAIGNEAMWEEARQAAAAPVPP